MTAVSQRIPATIATERLVLRLFTPDDVDDRYAYQSLPEVARFLYRPPLTRESCAESIAARAGGTAWQADGDGLLLAVCRAGEPGVIGEVVLTLANARARQAEIGWVFDPRYAGQGYATEAARALTSLAFGQLGAHRVYARLDALNTASARVCERLGMRHEAHLVESDLDEDRWGSEYVYAILAREWPERQTTS
ncbi:GNAT family N-acetyltransferase [Streptomyces sp. 5-8]|uniref:GNAT family N-acetyltransferase n=1 Tax=Streptomyces musisoli TaxID=2802280 RepID=A0ABS1PAB8_9ACTN|nr:MULTISPECIES: GNAT family protein [Streptomyces]MBL1108851.1 GNAT family N-acetyltransferase [Streptomyces musisoli]MBY8842979.1 GNAT family N-acetyltransferase [Streptomyces sp. SP2-10]